MTETMNRLSSLRAIMKQQSISACIVPGTDPHASEYIADFWKEREWISGFNGSAGTAVITLDKAGLWTDSRYFLQAGEQLANSGFELMKMGEPDTLDILPWLVTQLNAGDKVGINAQMFSMNAYAAMNTQLKLNNLILCTTDLIKPIWENRKELPKKSFFPFDTKYSGKATVEKLSLLRTEMKKLYADTFVMTALDEIAWIFNIRGNDVNYNPVVISYALIEAEKATLFVEPEKVNAETSAYLASQSIAIADYNQIYERLKQLTPTSSILVDGTKLNQAIFEALPTKCIIRNSLSPVNKLKSIKNETELEGFKTAMVKDGVALTRFFIWLEETVKSGNLTEISVSQKLKEFRSEDENFMGESFHTICGYGSHGAIVHYSATTESDATIKDENILLLDSGGQYLEGTTDITRTVALGSPTAQQKTDFTLVLKGHIALATANFPVGTRGSQLDILARKAMWDLGLNYGHGTGHGVGHFLNVHEGPQSIRADENPTQLEPGMVISNEPGMYRTDKYGIRTENLIVVVAGQKTEFGQFLKFETLTLFPIDQELIDWNLMSKQEIEWINNYHQTVYETLSKKLNEYGREWLSKKCSQHIRQ